MPLTCSKARSNGCRTSGCHTLPVLHNQKLVGLLTAENLGEFLMIKNARNGRQGRCRRSAEETVEPALGALHRGGPLHR